MKLFLFIALVAIIAIVVISMRGGTSVTTIEHRRDKRSDREGEDEL